jgi:hypothetical protein
MAMGPEAQYPPNVIVDFNPEKPHVIILAPVGTISARRDT